MDYLCFRALCCKGPPPARPEYDLVCIDLTGSGKTSLLAKLCGESPENVVSTTGFSIKAVPFPESPPQGGNTEEREGSSELSTRDWSPLEATRWGEGGAAFCPCPCSPTQPCPCFLL
ncbi:ADP-ribosylation factor-like protein 15 [Heterocephalus glaber]|uniref:ADP-ribosylation factor-like protein 15 n=1 Tax=Heterocephalus glaber TaxID=10181 RepID=G5APU5_HETGA|nr:ADP-ribosylation factor-like protein 15 [Heterocephalus glaber]